MHIHIQTKVWDQMGGEWDTHMRSHRVHTFTQLCKLCRVYMANQVDMHTCNDACTHSKQCVGPEEDDCDVNKEPYRGAHLCIQLC